MRAISPYPRYSIQVVEGTEQVGMDQRGSFHSIVLKKPVIANFQQGGILPWEYEAALTKFSFSGIPDGVNPLSRISHFDTEAYAAQNNLKPEEVEEMEERFRYLEKLNPSEFCIVDKPPVARPWPSYDADTVEEILELQERLQVNPEVVRLYEYENKGRKGIIEEMESREAELRGGVGAITVSA